MQGTTVDSKYQIVRRLGQGGMGAVYEARHLGTGRKVALKVLVPTALVPGHDMLARFQREARASGAIDSQHVVQVLDTGVDPQTESPYLVMECLTGEDLQQLVHRVGALPSDVVLCMMAQACSGLTRAHEAGIVHRDIKSANLFVARREAGELTIKILDFGIAKVRADPMSSSGNRAITRTGALLGSPLYMSSEQVLGSKDIDVRSDVYSLGVTMYEALCGATPNHECETVGMLIVAICAGKGKSLLERAPWVPPQVAAIVEKAIALDANARYQSAAEMSAAIMALLPQGTSLNASMLVGMSAEMKSMPPAAIMQTPQGLTVPLPTPLRPTPPPPANGSSPPAAPSSPPATPSQSRGVAATATAFTDTGPGSLQRSPRWLVALPIGLLLLSGAGLGFYRMRAANVTPAGSSSPVALVSAPPSAMLEASAPQASAATETAAKVEVDADAAVAPVAAVPVAPVVPVAAVTTVRQRMPLPQAPPPVVVAPAPKPNCDPPYMFNSDGKKIWKRECL